jgi:DNA-binding NarL/FixJ family response regulator
VHYVLKAKAMANITVILVEDHEVVREGLRAIIRSQPDIQIVGEASNGREAVTLTRKLAPDVVVMDIAMPTLNGLEATREIVRAMPGTKVLALSSYDDLDCVRQMTDAGIIGFLTKRSAANHFVEAIRAVRSGRTFCSPEIARRLQESRSAAAEADELTGREKEALEFIAQGLRNKEVAAAMGISIKTVEKHRQSVMNKLNIHESAGLTRYALAKGLVTKQAAGNPRTISDTDEDRHDTRIPAPVSI